MEKTLQFSKLVSAFFQAEQTSISSFFFDRSTKFFVKRQNILQQEKEKDANVPWSLVVMESWVSNEICKISDI